MLSALRRKPASCFSPHWSPNAWHELTSRTKTEYLKLNKHMPHRSLRVKDAVLTETDILLERDP